jgi:peptide-methionine (S)-S-oxide reductase
VGYTGGAAPHPTYHRLGDHTETVQIDFDPQRIAYAQLLAVFWQGHQPGRQAWSQQYKAAVFYHNEEQRRLALESRERVTARLKSKVFTEILPASTFYLAEDYHQKYYLRQVPELWREFALLYPAPADLVNSTAAARVNGYLAGHGSLESFQADLPNLGLSPPARAKLQKIVSGSNLMKRSLSQGQAGGGSCPLPPTP